MKRNLMFKDLPLLLALIAAGASGLASAGPISANQLASQAASAGGLNWLLSHQNADGSFGSSNIDTAAAVIAIGHLQVAVQTFPSGAIPQSTQVKRHASFSNISAS